MRVSSCVWRKHGGKKLSKKTSTKSSFGISKRNPRNTFTKEQNNLLLYLIQFVICLTQVSIFVKSIKVVTNVWFSCKHSISQ